MANKKNEQAILIVDAMKEKNLRDWNSMPEPKFQSITSAICDLRRVLNSDGLYPHEVAKKMHEMRIKQLEDEDLMEKKKILNRINESIKSEEEAYAKLIVEMEECTKLLTEKKGKLRKAEKLAEKLEADLESHRATFKDVVNIYERMQHIVLFHKSATLKQVLQFQVEEVWISQTDSEDFAELSESGIIEVEGIFEIEEEENFIYKFPSSFYNKYDESQRKSIIDF